MDEQTIYNNVVVLNQEKSNNNVIVKKNWIWYWKINKNILEKFLEKWPDTK